MKYRVFAGSIQQETNSFSPAVSDVGDFEFYRGAEALGKLAIEPLMREDIEIVPGIYAHAVPSGTMRREVFDYLLGELLAAIEGDIDGVFLYLHGALDVEGLGSGDAEIVRAVRERVGERAYIAVAMDFHANVSPVLMRECDLACAYRTAPHVDMEDTQRRACRLLIDMLARERRPFACMARVPMLFTGDCVITGNSPARELMALLEDIEREEGMIHLSLCFGQPWVDTRWVGTSVLAYADSPDAARAAAKRLAQAWWDQRANFGFLTETCLPEQAFDLAYAPDSPCPVFLSDSGDNTTAGAAGDRAGMLRLAVESGRAGILIAGLTDDAAVAALYAAGVGGQAHLSVGGTLDRSHGEVYEGEFTVLNTSNILGWYGEDAGRSVVARTGSVDVIITEHRCAVTMPEIPRSVGVEIMNYRAVVVKLGYLYPKLAEIAPRAIFVMSEGTSTARIDRIAYSAAPRPVYPVDADMEYDVERYTIEKN